MKRSILFNPILQITKFAYQQNIFIPLSIRTFSTRSSQPSVKMDSPKQDVKRVKTEPKSIGTHNGAFHADEALAVYLLRLTEQFANATVTRSRDPETLEKCDIIVDVQGVYDGTKHFDHHQRGFTEVFSSDFKTKLSSAGLIYKHFGMQIIAERLALPLSHPSVTILYNKLYKEFIEAIDANDNGISAYPKDGPEPAFKQGGLTLPSLVGALNPWWNQPFTDEVVDERFQKASVLMGEVFVNKLDFYGKAWLPARDLVVKSLASRKELDPSGKIMKFEQSLPWKEHLYNLEEEQGIVGEVLYVLYSDGKGWRIQAVPESTDSFASRKALPEAWRGVRDDALSQLSGIDGCIFVHASGFIGGNKSYEGALEMAKQAIRD